MKTLSTSAKPFWRTLRFLCIGLLALTVLFGVQINSTNSGFITPALGQEAPDSKPSEANEDTADDDEDSSDPQDGHAEDQPETDTPVPELSEEEQEKERLQKVLDAMERGDIETLKEYVPTELSRKFFQEAMNEIGALGRELDLSAKYQNTQTTAAIGKFKERVLSDIMSGAVTESEGLRTFADTIVGTRFTLGHRAAMDARGVSSKYIPGDTKSLQFTGDGGGSFHLNDGNQRVQSVLNNWTDLLNRGTDGTPAQGHFSAWEIVDQQAFRWGDPTSVTQGNMGSCWACSAEAQLWAWRPDIAADAINQLMFTGKFVSDFTYETKNGDIKNFEFTYFPSKLKPTRSNKAFSFEAGAEQAYVDHLLQALIGTAANDPVVWGGGNPGAASRALGKIAGILAPNISTVGGIQGFINGINDGTMRHIQYIPFRGHSATQSGFLLPTKDGGFVGIGINDNSWGTKNEHAFLATPENANKFVFPGGGGSRFGGEFFGDGMNRILNGFQNLGNQQNQNAVQLQTMTEQKATDSYSKLTKQQKELVRNICIQNLRPGSRPPNLCKPAVKDKSLPPLIAQNTTSSGSSSIQRSSIISSF